MFEQHQPAEGRRFWPADLFDESMPTPTRDPAEWVVLKDGTWVIQGWPEMEIADRPLAHGDLVEFFSHEGYGTTRAERDGTGTMVLVDAPLDANWFWVTHEDEVCADSASEILEAIARDLSGDDGPFEIGFCTMNRETIMFRFEVLSDTSTMSLTPVEPPPGYGIDKWATDEQLRIVLSLEPDEELGPDETGAIGTCSGEWRKNGLLWEFKAAPGLEDDGSRA